MAESGNGDARNANLWLPPGVVAERVESSQRESAVESEAGRVLALAQRTADETLAEARERARAIVDEAEAQAATMARRDGEELRARVEQARSRVLRHLDAALSRVDGVEMHHAVRPANGQRRPTLDDDDFFADLRAAMQDGRPLGPADEDDDDFEPTDAWWSSEESAAGADSVTGTNGHGAHPPEPEDVVEVGDVVLDLSARVVRVGSRTVSLDDDETDLLEILLNNAGSLVHRQTLLRRLWDADDEPSARLALETHLTGLRAKIEDDPSAPVRITTAGNAGYRYRAPRQPGS